MGRDVTADGTPLLKAAEQNIGNSVTVQPQSGNSGVVIPQTNPPRILDLSGGSASGQTTSVIKTESRILQGQTNPNPGFPGPITGIVEFGNGGRFTRVEFDIPVGPFDGTLSQASSAVEPQDGMVIITVPTGVLRAYARYDNLLLAPVLGSENFAPTGSPKSHAQISGVQVVGPGGPLTVDNPSPPPNTVVVPAEPVLAKAMAAYFTKPHSKVYKTLNCYLSNEVAAPTQIQIGTPSVSQIAGFPGYAFWALPAFTKRVKVLRFDTSIPLSILLHDGIRPVDFFNLPGGSSAVEFNIVGSENIIGITSGASTVKMLKLVCELGL